MKEFWKAIKDYESRYKVSNLGRVYSINNAIVLKNRVGKNGYLDVSLSFMGKQKVKKVHRLVYEAFIGDLDLNLVIDHKDNNPKNNQVSNLRQISSRSNTTRGKLNKTGLTGVRFFKKINKYGSEIQIENKIYFLGVFTDKIQAKLKYDKVLSDWVERGEKPQEIADGLKKCRVCGCEKKIKEFRETRTMKGTQSLYYACLDCEKKLKSKAYYKKRNKINKL